MRNMHLRILKAVILFGLICLLVLPGRVAADSVIKSIDIIQVDSSHFPDISFTVDLLDSTRTPVTQLSAESLIVKENDIQMPYTFVSTQRGVNVVVVLDISDAVQANGRSGKPILDEMRTAALAFVDTMQPVDAVEVLAVTGNKPEVVQAFTNDAGVLKTRINDLKYDNVELRSYGLAGVCQAITNLDNAYPNPAPKLILFMTSGIQQNIGGCLAEDVINKSRTGEIWVHTIFMGSEATTGLDQMSEGTQAEFIHFNSVSDINPLYTQIGLLRQQYTLTFRSQVSSSSERTLQVSINPESSSAPVDSFSFTVQPSPQAPTVTGIVVNEGSPILRTAPDSDSKTDDVTPNQVPVTASVTWSDGYPRVLQNARIEVDGVPLGDMIVGEDGSLSFTWDIRGYFTSGTNTARIKIIARDELGMEGASELDIPIEVTIPSALDNAFCLEAQKVPGIGDWLYATCIKLNVSVDQAVNVGIGLIASIVVIIALIVIIILLISNRKAVARAGQKMGSQVSTIASRMTQRIGAGPKQARAQLEVLAGGQVGKHYDLYGKTTIGRDPQKAQLALENPLISREHCTFHLDMNAGKWTIEDLESSNGTYLNSQLLAPHQKKELKNGDTIDIAPIPKGGIRLRFLILVTPLATVTLKQGAQVPDPYATRKGITPPPPPTGAPTAPSGTPQAPATGIPTVPQPAGKPTIPQPQPKPTIPQPTGTPTIPQPQGKPTIPQPTGIPTIPQPGISTIPMPVIPPAPPTTPNQAPPTVPHVPAPPTTPNYPAPPTVPNPPHQGQQPPEDNT